MDKFVVKKASPPPSLGVYRGEIAVAAARKGLLALAPDQPTDSMFNPQKTSLEFAHCGTLYKNIHNGKLPKTLVEDFNKVLVARVKAMAPNKQSDANAQLQADLTEELEERWLQSDQKLLDMFGDVVKANMESYNAMPPSPERMSLGTSIECLEKVQAAWHMMPLAERNISVLQHLFQKSLTALPPKPQVPRFLPPSLPQSISNRNPHSNQHPQVICQKDSIKSCSREPEQTSFANSDGLTPPNPNPPSLPTLACPLTPPGRDCLDCLCVATRHL